MFKSGRESNENRDTAVHNEANKVTHMIGENRF